MRRLVLVAAVVVLVGCGSDKPTEHDLVAGYITRVNAVQRQAAGPLAQVRQAIADFGQPRKRARATPALEKSEATLRRVRRRLAALPAPPAARRLRTQLLRLTDEEAALTHELYALGVFDPKFTAALQPLLAANEKALQDIKGQTQAAPIADALKTYRAAVRRAGAALKPLDPPAVEQPTYDAQTARLASLDKALGKLLAALAANDPAAAARAEHAVSVASVSADSLVNQKAQRAAVADFDNRVAHIEKLQAAIAEERNRLQVTLK